MNTKRNIISEVEQLAVNAIVSQPDEREAAEKHFSETAKKIVETAMQAIDYPTFYTPGWLCELAKKMAAEEEQHPEMRPVRPQTLDDIGMTMDKRVSRDANGEVVRIDFAGIRHLNGTRPYQLWGICVSKNDTGNDGTASHISVFRDHEIVFSGTAFFGLEAAADVAISMMIRKIIGNTAKRYRDRFRNIRKPTAMTKAAKAVAGASRPGESEVA